MTNLATLAPPTWAIPVRPRAIAVEQHRIRIRAQWWHTAITTRGLPGKPPGGADLTRAQVWSAADEDAFTLLWRTLAWGSGSYLRNNARRLDAVRDDLHHTEKILRSAAETARHDPAAAYALLRPAQHNTIRCLGPSFFTKFLYFAGGGAPGHPCLILDRVVATALRDHGWTSLYCTRPWSPQTYERYCDLLARWAREHDRAADEFERALFTGPALRA